MPPPTLYQEGAPAPAHPPPGGQIWKESPAHKNKATGSGQKRDAQALADKFEHGHSATGEATLTSTESNDMTAQRPSKAAKITQNNNNNGGSVQSLRRKKKQFGMPKRPLSAYYLYLAEHDKIRGVQDEEGFTEQNIGFENREKIIMKQWQDVSSEVKKVYEEFAEKDSERYRKEIEEYHERKQKMYRDEDEAFEACHAATVESTAATDAALPIPAPPTTTVVLYHGILGGGEGSTRPAAAPSPPFRTQQKSTYETIVTNVNIDGSTDRDSKSNVGRKSSSGAFGGVSTSVAAAAGFTDVYVPGGGQYTTVAGSGPRFISAAGLASTFIPFGVVHSQQQYLSYPGSRHVFPHPPLPHQEQFHRQHYRHNLPSLQPISAGDPQYNHQSPFPPHQQQQHPYSSKLKDQMPLPPGMEITLTDQNGSDRRYKVEYACYSMTREGADRYINNLMQYATPIVYCTPR
jgi:hypothetical protein